MNKKVGYVFTWQRSTNWKMYSLNSQNFKKDHSLSFTFFPKPGHLHYPNLSWNKSISYSV